MNILKARGSSSPKDIVAALKDKLPDLICDSHGTFMYLPKTLPIDYAEEVDAFRNAVLVLMSV
jgi:hypothetical protein